MLQDSLYSNVFSDAIESEETLNVEIRNQVELRTDTIAKDEPRHSGVHMPFTIEQSDSVFGLLLFCFLFFTHIYNGGYTFLKENVGLLMPWDKNDRIHRLTTTKEIFYSYFLVFQAIVLVAIAAYDIFIENDRSVDAVKGPFVTIILFIIFIGLFFGLKDLLYRFLGYLFDNKKPVAVLRRIYIVAIEILGMLYFLPVLLLVYSPYYHFQIIIFMVILFLIVQILLFYQIIVFFIREKFNFLYLIAYLCTFEILPYIFLFVGLAYLYKIDVFNTLWH